MAPSHPASGIVLHLDESASSKTVLLVANIVRWVSNVECSIQLDSQVRRGLGQQVQSLNLRTVKL